ncbi:MAG: hypothetical protein Q8K98_09350 [Bacteroidota bacterium]|nr:hypothetical protein [Bacteroidota bacterium]
MNPTVLYEIKNKINQLSYDEQLWLIEQLAHGLRESKLKEKAILENQLTAMASDPELQSELKKMDEEFVITELDGLGKV